MCPRFVAEAGDEPRARSWGYPSRPGDWLHCPGLITKLHEQSKLGRDSVMVTDRSGEPPIEKVQTVEKGGDESRKD